MANIIDLDNLCNGCDFNEGHDICTECIRSVIHDLVHGCDPVLDRYVKTEV